MPAKDPATVSAVDRVRNSYKQLASASHSLNCASDGLKEAISVLDAALERLNLGIAAWVKLSGDEDEDGAWWSRDIGYTRIGDSWCIALRTQSGDYRWPERDSEQEWPFAQAPRWMRIEAVAKLPDLFEALLKQTEDATRKLEKRTEQVLELGVAMSGVLDEVESAQQKAGSNA